MMVTWNIWKWLVSHLKVALVIVAVAMAATACDSPEERLQSHYESGAELLAEGSFDKASLEFRNALQINGDHIPSLFALSQIEERRANWRGVRNLLEKIVDLDPKHLGATVRLGRMMLLGGQIDRALDLSKQASEIDPKSVDALTFKAAVLLNLDDPQGSLAAASEALKIDPDNIDAISVLAAERIAAGEMREAIALLDTGIKQDERNAALQLIKIRALAAINALDEVEDVLKRMIELYPDTDQFRSALINLYARNDRLDDAEAVLRDHVKNNPTNFEANLSVVRFLNTARGKDAAVEELQTLVGQADKNQSNYRLALAQLYYTSDQQDEAKFVLADLIESDAEQADKLRARNQLAEMARLSGDAVGARNQLQAILSEDSKNADALMTRAAILISEQKYDDAIIDLRTVLRDDPEALRALILLGSAYEGNDSPELADDQYTRAFQVANGSAAIGLPFANFLVRRGSVDRAEEVLERVVQSEPRNIAAYRALAQIRVSRGDWVGAEAAANSLAALEDDQSIVNRIRGIALQGQQKFEQSIAAFEQSQQAAPDEFRPMASLVDAYFRAGEPEKAEAFLESVLEASPSNVFAHALLGQLYTELQRTDKAVAILRQGVDRNPKSPTAYTALAQYYGRQGEREAQLETLEQGLGELPNDPTMGLLRAGVLEQLGRKEDALEQYQSMYDASTSSPIVANNYASMLMALQESQVAAQAALDAMTPYMRTPVPHFRDTIGWAYYLNGENEKALPYLEQAAEQLPNLAEVRYHLGKVYRAEGNLSAAIKEFEKVVDLSNENPFERLDEVKATLEALRKEVGTFSGD